MVTETKTQGIKLPKTGRRLDRRYANALKDWSPEELEILGEKYGLVRDKTLARMLQRSPNALHIAAVRKLHMSHSYNFYTACNVAEVLGISDSKTIIFWMKKGWINGTRSVIHAGANIRWRFLYNDIEWCVHRRPWLCNLKTMPKGYFRNIVNEEFEKDPWYADCLEVAKLLGIKDINAVHRYIRKGWLKAERKPGGPHQGRYLVRRSDVEAFLATDQRPSSAETASRNMRGRLRRDGRPIKLSTRWIVRCSKCGHDVVVTAPPRMYGSAILKRMYEKYPSNGICAHGFRVVI